MAWLMSHDHLIFTIGCVIAAVGVVVILTSTRSALYYLFSPFPPFMSTLYVLCSLNRARAVWKGSAVDGLADGDRVPWSMLQNCVTSQTCL